jgi:PST family polysaccharide transporter
MGPTYYGKIGFATALMVYFQLFTDFGFILSATEEVSKNRDNKEKLKRIYTSVTILKMIFAVISVIILITLCLVSKKIKSDYDLYILYLMGVIIYSFLPDYLYRGLEQMSEVTYRTIFVRLFFTVMIILFLKKPEDYLIVPILIAIGNLFAVVWASYHVSHKLQIKLCRISLKDINEAFKSSAAFFLSRIATTIYTATNTIILGFIYKTGSIIGYYTAADKLMVAGKGALSPISDSVYPYMIKNKDFKLIKKILTIFMPIICTGSIITFVFAKEICILLFGPEFAYTSSILRAMLPLAIITLPNYLFGFPTLGAMGLSKYANKSIYFGTVLHIFNLIILYLLGHLNVVTLALLASIADGVILIYRIVVIYKNKDLLSNYK